MILHGVAYLALGRAHVNDQLLRAHFVQYLRDEPYGCTHRDGDDDDIGLPFALLQAYHLVHQADAESRLCIPGIILHPQNPAGIAPVLQIQRQGTADKAQSYYS